VGPVGSLVRCCAVWVVGPGRRRELPWGCIARIARATLGGPASEHLVEAPPALEDLGYARVASRGLLGLPTAPPLKGMVASKRLCSCLASPTAAAASPAPRQALGKGAAPAREELPEYDGRLRAALQPSPLEGDYRRGEEG
jgi:hypothetical protein